MGYEDGMFPEDPTPPPELGQQPPIRPLAEIRADLHTLTLTDREGWTGRGEDDEHAAARRLAADVEQLLAVLQWLVSHPARRNKPPAD